MTEDENGEKTVSFRVFLSDDERTEFKVYCARQKTTMSQQARELIRAWLTEQQKQSLSPAKGKGGKGGKE